MSGTLAAPFDEKDPRDFDGFAIDFSYWLGPTDTFASTPTAVAAPSGLVIQSVALSGSVVTVWASGGTSGSTYSITFNLITLSGRNVYRTVPILVGPR